MSINYSDGIELLPEYDLCRIYPSIYWYKDECMEKDDRMVVIDYRLSLSDGKLSAERTNMELVGRNVSSEHCEVYEYYESDGFDYEIELAEFKKSNGISKAGRKRMFYFFSNK